VTVSHDLRLRRLQRLQDRGIVMRGSDDDNVWVVADQLLVAAGDVDTVESQLGNVCLQRVGTVRMPWRAPSLKRGFGLVGGRPTPRDESDDGDDDEAADVTVLQLSRQADPVVLAGELRAARRAVSPNHLVTALQRRMGFPDTDPEPIEPGALPRLPDPLPPHGDGVRVAVIDTGFPVQSPGLGWLDQGVDMGARSDELRVLGDDGHLDLLDETGDGLLDLAAGHGAFVAGIIRRLAPRAEIHFIKALDASGVGTEVGVARAIRWAARRRPHVINLSLGFYTSGNVPPPLVEKAVAIARHRQERPAIVAAAGNDGIDDPAWPASVDGVIGVGALDQQGGPAPFSNTGNVNAWAPGESVESCYVTGTEDVALTMDANADSFSGAAKWSGTSFAAAVVAGTIAAALRDGDPADQLGEQVVTAAGGRITAPAWQF
jgi:subtilisin family serine protease